MKRSDTPGSATLRIDGAHPAALASAEGAALVEPVDLQGELVVYQPEPALVLAAAGECPNYHEERLHQQAGQIVGHLRQRMRDVDRRESELNARIALLESALRTSQLWLREREYEFQERETALRQQVADLQSAAPAAPPAAAPPSEALLAREAELTRAEQQLRDRRQAIEREAAAIRHSQQLWEQRRADEERALHLEFERKTAEQERQLRERHQDLDSAELILTDHARQLERDRASLDAERQAWQTSQVQQQAALTQRLQLADTDAEQRLSRLLAREAALDKQRAGLEQLRTELLNVHRQSLEMRLVAEQLWSQLNGRVKPAEVTRSIAQLKLQLTEQYRLEERTLADQKQEIAALGTRLSQQHEALQQQRQELRSWATNRQAEIEAQARQLVARELELDRQQDEHRQATSAWQADRRRYEQQIRSLASQLRQTPAAA